jgi:hypothetical protein
MLKLNSLYFEQLFFRIEEYWEPKMEGLERYSKQFLSMDVTII